MYPQVEYFHSIMEMQELQEPSVTPNVVEKAKYPHDMDRGVLCLIVFWTSHTSILILFASQVCLLLTNVQQLQLSRV